MFADLALVAIATEAMVGYPNAVYRLIGHPVTWIGKLITWCDDAWNSGSQSSRRRYGILTLIVLLFVALLSGFAIAGTNQVFAWATASIEGDKVVVSNPAVPQPVAVRYGWSDFPVVNLFSKQGLPATPFRTDDWKMETKPEPKEPKK